MTEYVLILSVGPVQGFIAAARRSRDLWSGSWLLSEIAKAGARQLLEDGARLIFPSPNSAAELAPGSAFSVGNKLQAVVAAPDATALSGIAQRAAQAARDRFVHLANEARTQLGHERGLRPDIWDAQIGDYVEVFHAWARIDAGHYARAAATASRALAARKATRNFAPAAIADDDEAFMLPKSSLDGARETILKEGELATSARRKLGLAAGEQLDCAGLTKRLAGNTEQFTPFSRIAAHAWLSRLPETDLEALRTAYEPLVALGMATRVKGNAGHFAALPYDAQLCFPFRLEAAQAEYRSDANAIDVLATLQRTLRPIWHHHGEPTPYGVILLADGDKMGALLNEVDTQEAHIEVTRALSAFAGSVPEIVRTSSGHAIYAGGDDVLAFVPLDTAFECAQSLQQRFAQALQPVATRLGAQNAPTLSVGLAIGHMLQPLGTLRALATQAERIAKGDDVAPTERRNALGVALDVRSGATIAMRLRWDDAPGLDAFAHWQRAYLDKHIPSRIAYDTRAVHQRTAFAEDVPGIALAEFSRMLARARTRDGETLSKDNHSALEIRAKQIGLKTLADELIIARWLAARIRRDLGDIE